MPKCPNITQRINIMCTKVQEFFEKHNNLINRNNPKVQLSPISCRPFHKKGACFSRKGCTLCFYSLHLRDKKQYSMSDFKIRAYGLQELAMLYFPQNTPQSASNQLKKWMNKDLLLQKLHAAGYESGQKILTPRQVGLIAEHVGKP